jgi:hypothetical protein
MGISAKDIEETQKRIKAWLSEVMGRDPKGKIGF